MTPSISTDSHGASVSGGLRKGQRLMDKQIIAKLTKSFEEHAQEKDGVQFWMARDIQNLLGYARWENFITAVGRAVESSDILPLLKQVGF